MNNEEIAPKPKRVATKPKNQRSRLVEKAESILPIWEVIEKILVAISIFVPFVFLFIGGYFQIMELWKIDIFYVRFFSVTQLVSDSLIFLLVFSTKVFFPTIIGFIVGWILIIISFLLETVLEINIEKESNNSKYFNWIIIGVIIVLFLSGLAKVYIDDFKNEPKFNYFNVDTLHFAQALLDRWVAPVVLYGLGTIGSFIIKDFFHNNL